LSGARGTMAYSYDGINWTGLGSSICSSYCYNITYNPNSNMFVVSGSGTNPFAYSYNGINWTGLGSTYFTTGKCAAYIGTNWLACGNTGTNWLSSSIDGITWTALGKPTIMATNIVGIASNNNPSSPVWVAVGQGTNTIMYSTASLPDGTTNGTTGWTGVATTTLFGNGLGITYSVNTWIATGGTINYVATSTDLTTWTGKGLICGGAPNGIASNGANVIVTAAGSTAGSGNNIMVSINSGSTWLARGSIDPITVSPQGAYGPGGGPMYGVAWIPQLSYFLIGSYINTTGIRGKNQYMISSLSLPINNASLVGRARTIAGAIGQVGPPGITSNGSTILISSILFNPSAISFDKGITWSIPITWSPTLNLNGGMSSWCSGFNLFITFPNAGGAQDQSYYTSPTGETWTRIDSTTSGNGINGTNTGCGFCSSYTSGVILDSGATSIINTMVYISQGTSVISTSTNGTTWTGRGKIFGGLTMVCSNAHWIPNVNMFIVTGYSGTSGYIIKSTDNGITWTPSAFPMTFSRPKNICWSSQQQRLVIAGETPFLVYSNDIGVTWTVCTKTAFTISPVVNAITWNSSVNKWFACGTGGIAKSNDGITWTMITQSVFTATQNIFSIQTIP